MNTDQEDDHLSKAEEEIAELIDAGTIVRASDMGDWEVYRYVLVKPNLIYIADRYAVTCGSTLFINDGLLFSFM